MDCDTSGVLTPQSPFFQASAELTDTTTSRLFATCSSPCPTPQVKEAKEGTTRPWHRPLLHSEMESSLWLGFATSLKRERTETSPWGTVAEPVPENSLYNHTGKPN